MSSAPVWVRLLSLPLHLWNFSSLKAIGDTLSKFYYRSSNTKEYDKTTFARICAEMDIGNGFPTEIILTIEDYVWVQKLDYENILFQCRACYETCHLVKNCPKAIQYSSRRDHRKSTWWEGAKIEHYTMFKNESPLETDKVVEQHKEQGRPLINANPLSKIKSRARQANEDEVTSLKSDAILEKGWTQVVKRNKSKSKKSTKSSQRAYWRQNYKNAKNYMQKIDIVLGCNAMNIWMVARSTLCLFFLAYCFNSQKI